MSIAGIATRLLASIALSAGLLAPIALAAEPSAAGIEFFEKQIRPVLVKQCYKCHSAESDPPKGGLLLDHQAGLLKGGDSGPAIVPGKPDESMLLEAIRYGENASAMPPDGKLPPKVLADFEQWIALGAPDPRTGAIATKRSAIDLAAGRQFWAFRPLSQPGVPQHPQSDWPRTEIDAFIYARLQAQGLQPVDDADRTTLIRRAYFDLTGLPPSPAAVDEFLADTSANAWERVIDALLASPRFGERWARHWLDVAKYAESTGRSVNFPLNFAWRYRNYVIDALNNDKPYDDFIREQIAGDLLPAADAAQADEQLIATGFLAVSPRELNYDDRKEMETERYFLQDVDEQIDVTSRAFLAMTVSCARCHDHKFDPIPTADYYALAGIFRSSESLIGLAHGLGNSGRYYPKRLAVLQVEEQAKRQKFVSHQEQATKAWDELKVEMTDLWVVRRTEGQPGFTNKMREDQEEVVKKFRSKLDAIAKQQPAQAPAVMGMRDRSEPADVPICIAGEPENVGAIVPRGFLQVIDTGSPIVIPPGQSGRRELAEWIASERNPLTSRVLVNRLWHHLFGRGLVATVDNFGANGELPTHPELLDHLAGRLLANGSSIKATLREIMLSRVYQLSSANQAAAIETDPDNTLLWRMSRRRLEVEPLRDAMLAVSGQLDTRRPEGSPLEKIGADQIKSAGGVPAEVRQANGRHRSVYQTIVRDFEPEMFVVFDFPSTSGVHGRRDTTTVASQALFMMNNPFVLAQARHAAERLLAQDELDDAGRIELAYRWALCRKPNQKEQQAVAAYLAATSAGEDGPDAWAGFLQMLFASAEFRYLE